MTRTRKVSAIFFCTIFFSSGVPACGNDELTSVSGGMGRARGEGPQVHLPRPRGSYLPCAEGPNGGRVEEDACTANDLAFATSSSEDQEVYAPIGGVAWTHLEDPVSGFGRHVNIDLGDGTYVVLGYLKSVFVHDGEPVAEGELIGDEGCTGACSTDRVLVGRHVGDARNDAVMGTSIPTSYFVRNGDALEVLASDDFQCGGSPSVGYPSGLSVPRWHPNGTVVRVGNTEPFFLIEAERTRRFRDRGVFWSFGYDTTDVLTISTAEFACYPAGAPLNEDGQAMTQASDDGTLWLFVGSPGDPRRYRVQVGAEAWEDVVTSWGIPGAGDAYLSSISAQDPVFNAWPERTGTAVFRDGSVLREANDVLYVVSNGNALMVADEDTSRFLGYGDHPVFDEPAGTVRALFARVGDCAQGIGCLTRRASADCGGAADVYWTSDSASDGTAAGSFTPLDGTSESAPPDAATDTPAGPVAAAERVLRVRWQAPTGLVPDWVRLSGEWRGADGALKIPWLDLVFHAEADAVSYTLPGVETGDTFRFSVEFSVGIAVSWSCLGPYPAHPTLVGTATATVDDIPVPVDMNGDPTGATTGCGLHTVVP